MACNSHSPRVRGTFLQHCDNVPLPPEVIRHFFCPESCPLLAGSCGRYELQLSPGRKERKNTLLQRGVAPATSMESLRHPAENLFLSINRADGYWFEMKPSSRRQTNSASTNSNSSRGGSARVEHNAEILGEETSVGARRKGRAAQSFGGYEECDLYKFSGNEDVSLVYEIEYHESENYRRFFKGHPHFNFFTHSSSESKHGPCLLSIMPFNDLTSHHTNTISSNPSLHPHSKHPLCRIILRSKEHFLHGIIQPKDFHASDVRSCVHALARELGLKEQFRIATYPKAELEILNMDEAFVKDKVKIGVINIKPGQKTELEFLSNQDEPGPFREFLSVLGDRIHLKGFPEFDGGLDIHNNTTGKFSIYTRWEGYEVMCHVATLLPYSPTDEQMVQKKRHIGNDLVCIIFLEGDAVFSPRAVKSQYIHVFIVVKVLYEKDSAIPVRYKIATVCRDGVPIFSPYLFEKDLFELGPELKDFIICKCINSEKAAVKSPKFQQLQKRTRTYLLQHLCRAMEDYECVRKAPMSNGNVLHLNAEVYENVERLVTDYRKAFSVPELCDVVFIVGSNHSPMFGIKAIIASRSRTLAHLLQQSPEKERKPKKQAKRSSIIRRPSNSISRKLRSKFNCESPIQRPFSSGLRGSKRKLFRGKRNSFRGAGNTGSRMLQEYAHLDHYWFEEFDEISFSQLMEYLLCGQCVINPLTIAGLVSASDLFDLPELRQACFEQLPHCLLVDLVCPVLSSLETYIQFPSAKTLTVKVLAFLDQNAEDVLCSDFFPNISEFLLSSIMQRNLTAQEEMKLNAILSWADAHSIPLEHGNTFISHMLRQLDLKKLSSSQLMKLAKVNVIDTGAAMQAIAFQLDPNSVGSSEA